MRSLPLFHRLTGKPVIILGEGPMADPKRRLVERAGGVVIDDLEAGIKQGARMAFVAYEDREQSGAAVDQLRAAGVLVNVVDQPDLCDFTTPSLLERDPVLIAIGTSGASAGLAKHIRLRLEALLPQSLGALASNLAKARAKLRENFPSAGARRRVLDSALQAGGPLDPLDENSAEQVEKWLSGQKQADPKGLVEIMLTSFDPDDLTLRQARLLGMADCVIADPAIPAEILHRARADAERIALLQNSPLPSNLPLGLTVHLKH